LTKNADATLSNFAATVERIFPSDVNTPEGKKEAYLLAKLIIRQNCYFKFAAVDESRNVGFTKQAEHSPSIRSSLKKSINNAV